MSDEQRGQVSDALAGKGTPFEVDGVSFLIRPPTTEEYDDAEALGKLVRLRTLRLPFIAEVASEPCTDQERAIYESMIAAAEERFQQAEDGSAVKDALARRIADLQRQIDRRTLADEMADERATLARDRWLCMRLLCDDQGRQAVPLDSKPAVAEALWEAIPIAVKNQARPAIWNEVRKVREAPFSWEQLRRPSCA
ncbi:MAG TPA: hypothetical protein PKL67_08400 [Anaerolineae bacterium]|nr:hypothetical protein [Anaerolineae bacterium]